LAAEVISKPEKVPPFINQKCQQFIERCLFCYIVNDFVETIALLIQTKKIDTVEEHEYDAYLATDASLPLVQLPPSREHHWKEGNERSELSKPIGIFESSNTRDWREGIITDDVLEVTIMS
jgi:hypothetical protein